jgi:phage terminase large subunit-like protein
MLPTSHYDGAKADRAVLFIAQLKHTKAEWRNKPFILLPWQEDIIRTIFGVIDEDGYRQFKTCYITVAKKQGKTMLAAALALYLLLADGEYGAEVYSCAADKNQAGLIYREAMIMAQQNESIRRRVKVIESGKQIVFPQTDSYYRVLSSEAYSKHGLNPQAVLFDETHVADREMFRVMTQGSSDARRQPLHLFISTAGSDIHSVGYELHKKAMDIRDGKKIDPSFLPVIYAMDEKDDWTVEANWVKANPSLGVTVSYAAFRRAVENAKQNPVEENSFRMLRCNQWVKQSVRWMPMDKWDLCATPVDAEALRGRVCYGGLDLASTTDLSAFVLVFPPTTDEEPFYVLPHFWVPEETLDQRVKRDRVPYDMWAKEGFLFTTTGNVTHYGKIEHDILDLYKQYEIREIAIDRWNGRHISQILTDDGLKVIEFGQGFQSMSSPTKDVMRLTLEKRLAHGGNPVLRWMMDNVSVQIDPAENLKMDKAKSTERIDGAVALVMALDRALCGGVQPKSVYDTRGLMVLGDD